MIELVTVKKDDVFTDSMIIARGTGVLHKKLKTTIRKYEETLNNFGKLSAPYQAESTGGRPEEYYLLNEPQATFLITLLKNTKEVVVFKADLVKEFYAMRKVLMERQTKDWQDTRRLGKLTRKSETDTIKLLIEYAREQGSKNAEKLYVVYSRLANQIAGIAGRDTAGIKELNNLDSIEGIILHCIRLGMAQELHYKEIYQNCKNRLVQFKDIVYIAS